MSLTNEDLDALKALFTPQLNKIDERLDKIDERLDKVDSRLDKIDERLDKIDERLDKVDERLDKVDERLDKVDERLDKVDSRLDVLELLQKRTAKKLDDLQLDVKIAERDIRRDIIKLSDGMETVIKVLQVHELLPQ